jgi:hypothetical protein
MKSRALPAKGACLLAAAGFAALGGSGCAPFGNDDSRPGRAPTERTAPGWTVHRDSAAGYRVSYPRTWYRSASSLTPNLRDPKEILSLGTLPLRPGGGCAQFPTRALTELGPGDALVSLQERAGRPTAEFSPRAIPFRLGRPTRTEISACVPRLHFEERFIPFRDHGRAFYAIIALGRSAEQETRKDVRRILDSLVFFGPGRSRERGTP